MLDLLGRRTDPETGQLTFAGYLPGKCMKVRRIKTDDTTNTVEVVRSKTGNFGVTNVVTCGSSKACPTCAQRRAREACALAGTCIGKHLAAGLFHDFWMLTLTMPHQASQPMADVVATLKGAWDYMTNRATWKRLMRKHKVVSVLRVFETTFGKHGMHPHFHVGLAVDNGHATTTRKVDAAGKVWLPPMPSIPSRLLTGEARKNFFLVLQREFAEAWLAALEQQGVPRPAAGAFGATKWERRFGDDGGAGEQYAVRIDGAAKSAEYLTKWGLADELALGAAKSSTTQWHLLDQAREGSKAAGAKFIEFYLATKGMSVMTGLAKFRKHLGVTDDEVEAHVTMLRDARSAELVASGEEPLPEYEELRVPIPGILYGRAVAIGWAAIYRCVNEADARGDNVGACVEELLTETRSMREARLEPPVPDPEPPPSFTDGSPGLRAWCKAHYEARRAG